MLATLLVLSLFSQYAQAGMIFFECREDSGVVEESQSGYLTDKGFRFFSGPRNIKPKTQLRAYQVFLDPASGVAGFTGSTHATFYPTHISISDESEPRATHILKINRKTLAFEAIIERTDSYTSPDYRIRRDTSYSSNSSGQCRPIPVDPDNKI